MPDERDNDRSDDDGSGLGEETIVEILSFDEDDAAPPSSQPAAAAPGRGTGGGAAGSAELAAEIEAHKERYLRLRADFDNFRKRAERERAEVERYALAEPSRQLLPVVDNLQRALAASEAGGGVAGGEELRRGVEMILRQLEELLKRFGLVAVPAMGERFDPSVHEAVMHEESPDVEVPTVVAEFQRGYKLNDRLIRPAMVKVALPSEGREPAGAGDADAGAGRNGGEGE